MLNSYYYIAYSRYGKEWYFKEHIPTENTFKWTRFSYKAHAFLTKAKAEEYIEQHIRASKNCFVSEQFEGYIW